MRLSIKSNGSRAYRQKKFARAPPGTRRIAAKMRRFTRRRARSACAGGYVSVQVSFQNIKSPTRIFRFRRAPRASRAISRAARRDAHPPGARPGGSEDTIFLPIRAATPAAQTTANTRSPDSQTPPARRDGVGGHLAGV
jgi:hypothetical protein